MCCRPPLAAVALTSMSTTAQPKSSPRRERHHPAVPRSTSGWSHSRWAQMVTLAAPPTQPSPAQDGIRQTSPSKAMFWRGRPATLPPRPHRRASFLGCLAAPWQPRPPLRSCFGRRLRTSPSNPRRAHPSFQPCPSLRRCPHLPHRSWRPQLRLRSLPLQQRLSSRRRPPPQAYQRRHPVEQPSQHQLCRPANLMNRWLTSLAAATRVRPRPPSPQRPRGRELSLPRQDLPQRRRPRYPQDRARLAALVTACGTWFAWSGSVALRSLPATLPASAGSSEACPACPSR